MYTSSIFSQGPFFVTYQPKGGEKGPKIQIYKNAKGQFEGVLQDRHFEQISPSKALPVVTHAWKNATSELQKLKSGENRAEVIIDPRTNQSVILIGPSHKLLGGSGEWEQFEKILQKVPEVDAYVEERAPEKNLVVVLGNTGAGKSTFINYMHGCRMYPEEIANTLEDVICAENPVTEIGHGGMSLTEYPIICPETEGLVFADFPGFLDNRGPVFDIPNAYATRKMMVSCASIQGVVILINYHSLLADRGRGITEMAVILRQLFGHRIINYQDSIWLGITHVPPNRSLDKLKHFLLADEKVVDSARELVSRLAERLFIYDPLNAPLQGGKSRAQLVEMLRSSRPIFGPSHVIEFALSRESKEFLEKMAKLAIQQVKQQVQGGEFLKSVKVLEGVCRLPFIHRTLEEVCQRVFDEINRQLDEKVTEIAHGYSQEDENNVSTAEQIFKQLSEMKPHFAKFPQIECQRVVKEAKSHRKAYEKRKKEKAALNAKVKEEAEKASKAEAEKKVAEEELEETKKKVKEGIDEIKKISQDALEAQEALEEQRKQDVKVVTDQLTKLQEDHKIRDYRKQATSGLKRLLKECPSNMRGNVQTALDKLKGDSTYIHVYCKHTDSMDNAEYYLAILRENNEKEEWKRGRWQNDTHKIEDQSSIHLSDYFYEMAYGKGTENKASKWFNYEAKELAKSQEERKIAMAQKQEAKTRKAYHKQVISGLQQLLRECPSNMRGDVQTALDKLKKDSTYMHVYCIHTDSIDDAQYYLAILREDNRGNEWKGGGLWQNHTHKIEDQSSIHLSDYFYEMAYGKGTENKASKWFDYPTRAAEQRRLEEEKRTEQKRLQEERKAKQERIRDGLISQARECCSEAVHWGKGHDDWKYEARDNVIEYIKNNTFDPSKRYQVLWKGSWRVGVFNQLSRIVMWIEDDQGNNITPNGFGRYNTHWHSGGIWDPGSFG